MIAVCHQECIEIEKNGEVIEIIQNSTELGCKVSIFLQPENASALINALNSLIDEDFN